VGDVAQNTAREYQRVLALARGGDLDAMGQLPGAATAMLADQRNQATTRVQAMLQAAQTAADLAGVGGSAAAFAGQKDYQAQLFDVNTAMLEVLRADLQSGNISVDLLNQHLTALNGISTMIGASKDVTFAGLRAVEGETSTVADITDIVARATGNNEMLSLAILRQLQVPDAGSNFLSQTLVNGNSLLAGRLDGVIAAINKQSEASQAEIARQNNLTSAQAALQITKGKQSLAVGQVQSASQAIFDLAGSYGVFLNDKTGPTVMSNTAKFKVNEQGLFEADYDQISYGSGSHPDVFKADFYRAGGLYDQTYGRASELQGLAQEIDRQRKIIRDLGGIPAFAAGGLHAGGLRLVGENGPELEVTGPARYYSAAETSSMMSGSGNRATMPGVDGMVDELRALRKEVSMLRDEARATAINTGRTQDIMKRITKNGESMIVSTDGEALEVTAP
jgi:hypothetical protein